MYVSKKTVLALSVHGWHLQTVRGIVSNLPGNEVSFTLMIDFVYLDLCYFITRIGNERCISKYARAKDAKIVRSRDAQCNTEESP